MRYAFAVLIIMTLIGIVSMVITFLINGIKFFTGKDSGEESERLSVGLSVSTSLVVGLLGFEVYNLYMFLNTGLTDYLFLIFSSMIAVVVTQFIARRCYRNERPNESS